MKTDGPSQYLYDAEGRICATSGPGGLWGYVYDADGRRVAKGRPASYSCDFSSGFTLKYQYIAGPNGEQMTELDGQGQLIHTNAYANGELVAT